MKQFFLLLLAAALLCGCGAEQTVETVADEWVVPVMAVPKEISLTLPGEASVCAVESDSGRLYIGDGYEVAVQTLSGGDMDATLRTLTGFSQKELTVMQTGSGSIKRYEFVWACAGEGGQKLGHGVLLDDGDYHYCLSILRDAEPKEISQVIWSEVIQSFEVI